MESHAASSLASRLVPVLGIPWKGSLKVVLFNLHLKAGQTLGRWIGACPFHCFLTTVYSGLRSLSTSQSTQVTEHLQEDPFFSRF